ncbi:MAG TPA: hypothetical protein VE967_10230 [Gemmatimonadaceae bacterium]|nr:hypothetical protein [Gemmatimonadaceae bacterium]
MRSANDVQPDIPLRIVDMHTLNFVASRRVLDSAKVRQCPEENLAIRYERRSEPTRKVFVEHKPG